MRTWCKIYSLVILGCSLASPGADAASSDIDSQVLVRLKHIDDVSHTDGVAHDQLPVANDALLKFFISSAAQPALMRATLDRSAGKGLWVAASKDHKIRIYSWDTSSGGTCHSYDAVAQFEAGGILKGAPLADAGSGGPGAYYTDIKSIRTKSGDIVYLFFGAATIGSDQYSQTVTAYSIQDGALVKTNFFKTPKQFLQSIEIVEKYSGYDLTGRLETTDNNHTLKVSLLDKELSDTGGFLIYKFDGEKFVYSKQIH